MDNLHDRHGYTPLDNDASCASAHPCYRTPRIVARMIACLLVSALLLQLSQRRARNATSPPTAPSRPVSPSRTHARADDEAAAAADDNVSTNANDRTTALSPEYWHHTQARIEAGGCPAHLSCVARLVLTAAPRNVSLLSAGFGIYAMQGGHEESVARIDEVDQKAIMNATAHEISALVSHLIDAIVPNLDASLTCLDTLNASAIAETILKAAGVVVNECTVVTDHCMKEFLISDC